MITLFVGDNDKTLSDQARAHDAHAFLIDHTNWKKFIEDHSSKSITVYTSAADLPKIDSQTCALWQLIMIADMIIYCPPYRWSDHTGSFAWAGQQSLTEYLLVLARHAGKNVQGLVIDSANSPYLELVATRVGHGESLWISGCSISHGAGVDHQHRYGDIIGRRLGMPTYHLTRGGTSIEWAADQILRSDIRTGDIVIWGLTQETRGPLARNGKVTVLDDSPGLIDHRLDETRYYKAITSVNQVINVTRKIGCQLILLPILCSEKLCMDLIHHDELHFLPYQTRFIDLGTDHLHPGPRQHAMYAEFCLKIITHARRS